MIILNNFFSIIDVQNMLVFVVAIITCGSIVLSLVDKYLE